MAEWAQNPRRATSGQKELAPMANVRHSRPLRSGLASLDKTPPVGRGAKGARKCQKGLDLLTFRFMRRCLAGCPVRAPVFSRFLAKGV